jgi:hypothetical protein
MHTGVNTLVSETQRNNLTAAYTIQRHHRRQP